METLEALRRAGNDFVRLAEALEDHDLALPSVCGGWTVEDLVAHVVSGCRMTVALAAGSSSDEATGERDRPLEAPLVEVLRREVGRQFAAIDERRVDELIVHHPIVDMTLTQLIETRIVEFVVHGSDLAVSVRRNHEIDIDVSAVAWTAMAPLAELTASLGVFGSGPSGSLSNDASPHQRLLDITGRRY
jgi:uncharacterized protein (TIGR03086 family)